MYTSAYFDNNRTQTLTQCTRTDFDSGRVASPLLRAEKLLFRVVREGSLPVMGGHLLMLNEPPLEATGGFTLH